MRGFEEEVADSQAKQRIVYVDIIKGWAMFAIIVFHCSACVFPKITGHLLGSSWTVPIFFIVAGFFLKMESMGKTVKFLKGKFQRLYLPATIIYGLNVLLHNVFVYIGWYPLGEMHPTSRQPFTFYGIKETIIGVVKVLAAGGSGELTMGAMWFLYTLLYAFVGMTIIYLFVSLVCKNSICRFHWMTVTLLFIAVVCCVLSQNYNLTISRFSTAATAMFLIWWGMIIMQRWHWQFDQWWGLAAALIVFVHCVLMHKGGLTLAKNEYQDLVMLLAGSTSAIYIWGFIGRKIESNIIGRFIALMGRESLYLMAFHIIGFFICNSLLVKLGVFTVTDKKGLYTYELGNSGWLLLLYVVFGVTTSFAIVYAYRGAKTLIIKVLKK